MGGHYLRHRLARTSDGRFVQSCSCDEWESHPCVRPEDANAEGTRHLKRAFEVEAEEARRDPYTGVLSE